MRIVAQFNPTDVFTPQQVIDPRLSGAGTVIIKNKSFIDIVIRFNDEDTVFVESGMARRVDKSLTHWFLNWIPIASNGIAFSTNQANGLGLGYIPFNLLIIEAYYPGEEIKENYPCRVPIAYPRSIQDYIMAGYGWTVSNGRQNAATVFNAPMSIFNGGPDTVVIYRASAFAEASTNIGWFFTSVDPKYASAAHVDENFAQIQQPPPSEVNCTFKNAAENAAVTVQNTVNNGTIELLNNGELIILLPWQLQAPPPNFVAQTPGIGVTFINSLNAATHYGMRACFIIIPAGGEIL